MSVILERTHTKKTHSFRESDEFHNERWDTNVKKITLKFITRCVILYRAEGVAILLKVFVQY